MPTTPDGYDMCQVCGHHTSACVAGRCTVFVPTYNGATGQVSGVDYCNCDCYKVLHGRSLMEEIFAPKENENG